MREKSFRYVVDASILRASGAIDAQSDLARRCTEVLEKILKAGHRAALCDRLEEEWKKHASRRARLWWGTMLKRRRLVLHGDPKNNDLRRSLVSVQDQGVKSAIEKDLHLIELALAFDKLVVSLDAKLKAHLNQQAKLYRPARNLIWLNAEPERIV